jgi:hypothetical protein
MNLYQKDIFFNKMSHLNAMFLKGILYKMSHLNVMFLKPFLIKIIPLNITLKSEKLIVSSISNT